MVWPSFMEVTFRRWFDATATQIAMFHTFFNTVCTVLFLPFCSVFVKISQILIKDKKRKKAVETYLDERMLSSPSLALSQIEKEMVLLADISMDAFRKSYRSFSEREPSLIGPTHKLIERANEMSQNIVNYLIRLSAQSKLSEEKDISDIHSNIGDIMRIAEIADNLTKYTRRSIDQNLVFSDSVKAELRKMVEKIEELFMLTKKIIVERDKALLPQIDSTEDEIDAFRKRLIDSHIERLNTGECRPESSSVFINLVSNLERLGDHLTYIAHTVQ